MLCFTFLAILIFAISEFSTVKSVSDTTKIPDEFIPHLRTQRVSKPYNMDLLTCIDSFDIHKYKIIRTEDSIAMGAKYINEIDLPSRDDCLRTCCETNTCDVFVFEEKSPGSCYLFHCGTPDDFKCKFTRHHNYSSAILTAPHPLTELESQIKLTKHEQQLTQLRKPDASPSVAEVATQPPITTASTPSAVLTTPSSAPVRACSHYQFECRTSGECIAIYNACDGIPQCADGSDEAAELLCPAPATTSLPAQAPIPTTALRQLQPPQFVPQAMLHNQESPAPQQVYRPAQVWQQQFESTGHVPNMNPPVHPPDNQEKPYARERMDYNGASQWQGYQQGQQQPPIDYRQYQADQNSRIFNHKGNGLVPDTDRYNSEGLHHNRYNMQPQYSDQTHNDFKYNNNMPANYYNPPYRQMMPNSWKQQAPGTSHDTNMPHSMEDAPRMPKQPPDPSFSGPPNPPDYYYEDSSQESHYPPAVDSHPHHKHLPSPQGERESEADSASPVQVKHSHHKVQSNLEEKLEDDLTRNSLKVESKEIRTTSSQPTDTTTQSPQSTTKVLSDNHHKKQTNSEKQPKQEADIIIEALDGEAARPSGAILSLAMGLCITGMLIVLLGCRLRVVRKRLRRGGKSPYAHDADYLVNGMYL